MCYNHYDIDFISDIFMKLKKWLNFQGKKIITFILYHSQGGWIIYFGESFSDIEVDGRYGRWFNPPDSQHIDIMLSNNMPREVFFFIICKRSILYLSMADRTRNLVSLQIRLVPLPFEPIQHLPSVRNLGIFHDFPIIFFCMKLVGC